MQPRVVLGAFAASACLFGFWLLCAMNDSPSECLAAAGGAALAMAGLLRYARVARLRFRFDRAMWAQVRYLPQDVFSGSRAMLAELGRFLFTGKTLGSHLTALPFGPSEDTPRAAACRALAESLPSCAPNLVTLGAIRGERLLLFHQTHRTRSIPIVRNLAGRRTE